MKKGRAPAVVPYRDYLLRRLADPAVAAAYLNAAVRERDAAAFLQALRNVVAAHGGIGAVAARADLNRQAIYRMLSDKGNPELRSLQSLLEATGLELSVAMVSERRASYAVRRSSGSKSKRRRRTAPERSKLAA